MARPSRSCGPNGDLKCCHRHFRLGLALAIVSAFAITEVNGLVTGMPMAQRLYEHLGKYGMLSV